MIKIRDYKAEDYSSLQEWFNNPKHKNWVCPPADIFSDIGFLAEKDGQKIAVGFLYFSNSEWVQIEFVVVNPEASRELRKEGVDLVLKTLIEKSKDYGKYLIMPTANKSLGQRLQKLGFIKTDSVDHYVLVGK